MAEGPAGIDGEELLNTYWALLGAATPLRGTGGILMEMQLCGGVLICSLRADHGRGGGNAAAADALKCAAFSHVQCLHLI